MATLGSREDGPEGGTDELDRVKVVRLAAPRLKVLCRLDGQQSRRSDDRLQDRQGTCELWLDWREPGRTAWTDLVRLAWNVDGRVLCLVVVLECSGEQALEQHIVIE